MNAIQILSNLENADFTTQQARAITEAIEERGRDDLKAIQDDIKKLATKEELIVLRNDVKSLQANMATKEELIVLRNDVKSLQANMATKEELIVLRNDVKSLQANMATKEELKVLQSDMKVLQANTDAAIAKAKYDIVRWIVGAVVANGLIATLLRFFT